jgi:hypothetical protein
MRPAELQATGGHAPLYRAVVDAAVNDGQSVMETLIRTARRTLHDREASVRTVRERQGLVEARQCLNDFGTVMVERYAKALQTAFARVDGPAKARVDVHFDQLELMDEVQIEERVELARAEQVVMLAVELSLAEFNPVMCAAAGLPSVRADRNPLRPELYVQALQTAVNQMQLSAAVRAELMRHMSEALGAMLGALYTRLTAQLRAQGVQAVGYAARPMAGGFDSVAGGPAGHRVEAAKAQTQPVYLSPQTTLVNAQSAATGGPAPRQMARARPMPAPHDDSLLTLEKLRQLLSGEFEKVEATPGPVSYAEQFAREFEGAARDSEPAPPDFDATVPAAFEALKEMQQVSQMMERIGNRSATGIGAHEAASSSLSGLRSTLRQSAKWLGQALSLEVVTLMVDNIAHDERLLKPVQDVVRSLEPALLRLALVDPRFFSDKQHPARRLLQEITQRSLAYNAVDAYGFSGFMDRLQPAAGALAGMQVEGAQPFEQVFNGLIRAWDEQKQPGQLESAMQALQHAEKRNLLAGQIGREIAAWPDVRRMPAGVLDFLYGPWAQVMAHARLTDGAGADDPGQYRELAFALLWSSQPELTRKKIEKLTQLVPKLLGKLREGLALIDYPAVKTSEFFELLMKLHQQAFKPLVKPGQPRQPDGPPARLPDAAEAWLAPAEAKLSGFMEAPAEMASFPLPAATLSETVADKAVLESVNVALPVGAWVELMVNGVWIRTQLSWASPQGTLFLFASASGSAQSMTRRSRDKLLVAGTMRVISGQAVVDGALDAVVQTAIANSIDVML